MCVYAYDRVLTSEFLLAALSHHPLEKVRKLSFRHVLVWSGVTSEVGPLLGLDVGHVGVCLGPLVLLLEPALFCGVVSAFAIGTFLVFRGGLGLLGLILIGVVVTRRVTRRVAAVGGVVRSRLVVLAPHFCFGAVPFITNTSFFHVESWIEVDLVHRHGGEEHGVLVGDGLEVHACSDDTSGVHVVGHEGLNMRELGHTFEGGLHHDS